MSILDRRNNKQIVLRCDSYCGYFEDVIYMNISLFLMEAGIKIYVQVFFITSYDKKDNSQVDRRQIFQDVSRLEAC